MNDRELLGYAEIHCQSDRALFSAEHLNRIYRLAGYEPNTALSGFYSMHEPEMKPLVAAARANLNRVHVYPGEWPEDIRDSVALSARISKIVEELRDAFYASTEMRVLRDIMHDTMRVSMVISSSRKYTRIEFPNAIRLRNTIEAILKNAGCEIIGNLHVYNDRAQFAVKRMAVNEAFYIEREPAVY